MNHKIVAVVCSSLILLTTVAFSQTGQVPIHSGNVQYSTNNASGMPRESVPSVPYSGFNSSGQGAYSNPSNPQRQVIPNQQNGAYVPQQQPAGQQYPTRQSQPIGQPYPTQPQPAGQPYPTQPQPAGQPYPTQSQPAGQPYPTQTRPVGQPYPTQPQPAGQPYPTQPQPAGQPYPTQSQPAGQPYPTQSQPAGQPYPTQPIGQPQSNAPFELTPQQQNQVNQVLAFWESYTRGIKKFEADFDLYSYPAVSVGGTDVNSPPQAQHTTGFLKYEAPNKGIFRIDGPPKELYRCNGKSVYTYNFDKKEINEYRYSDGSITGQELKKGPMAFLFGASAATLRDRYWIRLLPLPPGAPQGQIWLEAYPKYQEDLQDMTKAELIINVKPCKPVAFQRYSPNGDRQSYALKNIKVNKFELFGGEPFEPNERGWTVILSSQPE